MHIWACTEIKRHKTTLLIVVFLSQKEAQHCYLLLEHIPKIKAEINNSSEVFQIKNYELQIPIKFNMIIMHELSAGNKKVS